MHSGTHLKARDGGIDLEVQTTDKDAHNARNDVMHDNQAPIPLKIKVLSMAEYLELGKEGSDGFCVSELDCCGRHIAIYDRWISFAVFAGLGVDGC